MRYELIKSQTFNQCVAMESEGARISDLSQTIEILGDTINDKIAAAFELQRQIFRGEIGYIITSTKVRSVPRKGIYFGDKLVPFWFKDIYKEDKRKILFFHPFLASLLSKKTLENFYSLLEGGGMELTILEGKDSGFPWESRVLFDIDYQDNFLAMYFDHNFSLHPSEKYNGFLLRN
ncbi:MAG: hypothetical protein AABY15_08350 [Nanoarchaeota archaeon]